MTARVSSKGQIAIPKPIRDRFGLVTGVDLAVRVEGDKIILQKIKRESWRAWEGRFAGDGLLEELASEHMKERRAIRAKVLDSPIPW